MKRIALLICLLLVSGCSTFGQQHAQPGQLQDKAQVHLIRTAVGYGNLWLTIFSINDTKVVSLYDKGYSTVYLDPGTYKFSAGTGLNSDNLNFRMPVEAGKEYFVEYKQVPSGSRTFRDVIHAVNPVAGKILIDKFSFKEADKVYVPRTEYHALRKLQTTPEPP